MRYRKRCKKCGADVGSAGFFALRFLLQQSSVAAIRRVFRTGSRRPATKTRRPKVHWQRCGGDVDRFLDECRRKHGE